jgi:hypothetical protein
MLMCLTCFKPMPDAKSNKKYCCAKCKQKAYRERQKMMYGKSLQGHCAHCGDWFRDSRRGRPSKYCSPSCRQMAYLEAKLEMSEGITKHKDHRAKELEF